jgi:hypothetical protein
MSVTKIRDPEWWSWADIIRRADRLGIPNFQRGPVWDTGNRTALLESIYEQSPCGSFVLWEPEDQVDTRRHGVPLRAFGDDAPLWLVDGQQRTRTMLDVYAQLQAPHHETRGSFLVRDRDLAALRAIAPHRPDPEDAPAYSDNGDAQAEISSDGTLWMVVLPAMSVFDRDGTPLFGAHAESRSIRRGPVFRRLQPLPRARFNAEGKLRPVPPIPIGCIPLASLISPDSVFQHADLCRQALAALAELHSGNYDFAHLDILLPWGPQFLTGHAFEKPDTASEPARVMTWTHIAERRAEAQIAAQIQRLVALFRDTWRPVFERFSSMLTGNRFAIGWLPRSGISTAIDAYVRINRAGVRVRAEEQALALLSRARPTLLDDLATFTRDRDGGIGASSGRALLVHESERYMGFPLWMSTVTRFAALLLLGDGARAWLRTTAIEKDTFSYRLDRVGPTETSSGKSTWARQFESPEALIEVAVKQASSALLILDDILSTELYLDHRMARPPGASFTPVLEILSRIPAAEMRELGNDGAFRAALARLLHCMLLHPGIDQADMEALVVTAHGIDEASAQLKASPLPMFGSDRPGDREHLHEAIRRSIHRVVTKLVEVWSRHYSRSGIPTTFGARAAGTLSQLSQFAGDAFEKDVRDARSLRHRAVGWLYAVERRNGAREFSWRAQFEGNEANPLTGVPGGRGEPPMEALLGRVDVADSSAALYPEKQHLVPFSIATRIVAKGGTRATASPSNSIGNLTWLSQRQNGLEALSDRWAVMDSDFDRDNLEARGMLAPATIGENRVTVLDAYRRLSLGLATADTAVLTTHREQWLLYFDAFCRGRSDWMIDQMRGWLGAELDARARAWLEA